MKMLIIVLHLTLLTIISQEAYSEPYSTISRAYAQNIGEIQNVVSLRPVTDSNQSLTVNIDLNIASIITFDESSGYMEISGYLAMEWQADAYSSSSYSGAEMVPSSALWRPPILLINSYQCIKYNNDEIGDDTSRVYFNFDTKKCTWSPWIITRVSCTPNVIYFPSDSQKCSFKMAAWGYTSDEVILEPKYSELTKQFFEENGEWGVDGTKSETQVISNVSVVTFTIDLYRRPDFYVVNLVVPVIVLSALDCFVFVLPAESGERVGFSLVCFLSFVVLLNTLMDFLPTSAAPLSYLSYYTFIMMLFSAGNSVCTVMSLYVYYKDETDTVPKFLVWIYNVSRKLSYKCKQLQISCQRKEGKAEESVKTQEPRRKNDIGRSNGKEELQEVVEDDTLDESRKGSDEPLNTPVTWKTMSSFLDKVFFVGLLAGQIVYSVSYLFPIFFNSDSE